jgi:hypothetical protein
LFDADDVKAEVRRPIWYALSRCVLGQVPGHCLDGFLGLLVESIKCQDCVLEVGFHCVSPLCLLSVPLFRFWCYGTRTSVCPQL